MEVNGHLQALTVLRRPKGRRNQLSSRLVGPQSQSEPFGEKKNLHLPGIEKIFLSFSTRTLYTIPTELSHLLFLSCGAAAQRLLILEVTRSHTTTHHIR